MAKKPQRRKANFANATPYQGSGMMGSQGERDYFREPVEANTGKMQNAPDASINPARITQSVRMRINPIRKLTPEKLVSYLDSWDLGFFRDAGMLWEKMERRDYQMKIVAPKRKKAVARHGYEILTVDAIPEGMESLAEQQQEFLKYFYDRITVTSAMEPDEQGGFSLLVRQMMDAIGKRYAVHEIIWQPDASGSLTAKFIFCPIWWFEGTRGKLRFLESEFQVYGKEMNPGDWLVTVHEGIMEACSLVFLFKHLPLKSWVSYLDKFGMPGIHGKTDATQGSKEWNDFVAAVQDFAEEWAAVTNRSAEITLVEAKAASGGSGPFEGIVEKMDRAITQLWRGSDLSTSSSKDGAGASLQGDESEILETDDAKIAEETLTGQVSRFALAWKFGPDTPQLAYLKLRTTPQQNIEQDVAVDTFLTSIGGRLPSKATYERYGRSLPKDGEEALGVSATPAPLTDKKSDPAELPELANDSAEFEKNSLHELAQALAMDLEPVSARLAAIAQIQEPDLRQAKMVRFIRDIDQLKADMGQDSETARTLQKIIATGLANGIAAASKETKS